MACKIEFIPEAAEDFDRLDKSLRKQAAKKIDALSENPLIGDALGNRMDVDLTGFYKLYFAKKRYRIVYRIIGVDVEIVGIVGIGKRDKAAVYKLVAGRLKRKQG